MPTEVQPSVDEDRIYVHPAKVLRIAGMCQRLLDEMHAAPLDNPGRERLSDIYARSIRELREALGPELRDELDRLTRPAAATEPASDPQLRIAEAQLVGWLTGLYHGIQAALVAAQVDAEMQPQQPAPTLEPIGANRVDARQSAYL